MKCRECHQPAIVALLQERITVERRGRSRKRIERVYVCYVHVRTWRHRLLSEYFGFVQTVYLEPITVKATK